MPLHPIKRWRLKHGVTQKALADRLKVSDPAVAQWEMGVNRPDPDNALAVVLETGGEVTLAELYTWQPPGDEAA